MSVAFLPAHLPLLPLASPQLLYPLLTISSQLSTAQLDLLLDAVKSNLGSQLPDNGAFVAVVPVVEIERRVNRWATAARIKAIRQMGDTENYEVVLEGIARVRLPRSLPPVLSLLPPLPLHISSYSLPIPTYPSTDVKDIQTLARALLPAEVHSKLQAIHPGLLADLLVTVLDVDWAIRVDLLGTPDVSERCHKVHTVLSETMSKRGLDPPRSTRRQTERTSPPSSAMVHRPTAKAPAPHPNGMSEDLLPVQQTYERRRPELSDSAAQAIERELKRLMRIPPQSAEYGVARTYVEWLLALPWKKTTEISAGLDLINARKVLDDDHEGLDGVKRRIVEYLAVYQLKRRLFNEQLKQDAAAVEEKGTSAQREAGAAFDANTAGELLELLPHDERQVLETASSSDGQSGGDQPPNDVYRDRGPILLLVGPPGVGKTSVALRSVARSLANMLGRRFHRISLGGVRDEAEIRGHRRTYVGALPGLLVQGMRKVGVANPLILLDELDKVGSQSFHGDPSAALLETLDPAQNWSFHDHYLGDVPIDLSQCMFVATANSLETISAPLLDRCEVIECSGYVTEEKMRIARRFLLPRQIEDNGLAGVGVSLGDDALHKVVTEYTREAGVRSLERELGKVCRSKAVEFSNARETPVQTYMPEVSVQDVDAILGVPKYDQDVRSEQHRPGVVTGLAWHGSGQGGIMLIETTLSAGKGVMSLTGSLGDVIRESAEVALTWVRSNADSLGVAAKHGGDLLQDLNLHIHLPAGAVRKDGPSAGIGLAVAIISLLSGRSVPSDTAMTGEITLRGAVTPVGGIKEKVLGAHRAGIRRIILPKRNLKDVMADLPNSVKEEMEFAFVGSIEEAIEEIWKGEVVALHHKNGKLAARL